MTTTTNTSTAIVSVPRSNGTTSFRNRKMIATLVGFILCGAAAMVSSPSFQTSARSLLSFTEKRPVPEPTFQERLQSQWSSLFTPLTTTADLQETKVVLPFLKTTVRVPFLTLLQPEPQPEPTITETINAFFQTTAQQISSCSSSSYIACAIHIKDSVVTTMTTAGDKKKCNNFFSNKKRNTVASSYTACAIHIKDSVVKNCHGFITKFVSFSSETSAGDNNSYTNNGDEEEGESTKWWKWASQALCLVAIAFSTYRSYLSFQADRISKERDTVEVDRERAEMKAAHNLLWWSAMVSWYVAVPILVLAWVVLQWNGYRLWASVVMSSVHWFYQVGGKFWHQYNSESSPFRQVVRIEELFVEALAWKTLSQQTLQRLNEIQDAYYLRHGHFMPRDVYWKTMQQWYSSYMRKFYGGQTYAQIKTLAVPFFKNRAHMADRIKEWEAQWFDEYLTKKINELKP
eukprot:CAMPEP_0113496526 /NCGR_PEP_ID=MMETSP0014_2-20120614/30167_1 /TAXON_ID=2857 /ORGANISM="Nitzschia sp." /LENGTH=458 /DNA_ID=CAMNT_0000390451 /DNA_START=260 /DNA_END=1636 /DNA_ORIENTATION=+ /assembly_acc=CAM_ASM_000159